MHRDVMLVVFAVVLALGTGVICLRLAKLILRDHWLSPGDPSVTLPPLDPPRRQPTDIP